MHIERHEGFDRIVYDFGGTYAPRWRVEYVAEAISRGDETAIRINGRSILQVYFFAKIRADTPHNPSTTTGHLSRGRDS